MVLGSKRRPPYYVAGLGHLQDLGCANHWLPAPELSRLGYLCNCDLLDVNVSSHVSHVTGRPKPKGVGDSLAVCSVNRYWERPGRRRQAVEV